MEIQKYGRYWAVYDGGELVCICVYKKGAVEVSKRLMKGDANYAAGSKEKQAGYC